MIEPWVLITVFGAFFQNLRSALQKKAASQLTTLGASYTRFLFAFPFAIIYLFFLNRYLGHTIPTPSPEFFFYCVAGGIAQIVFTFLLISLFGRRNFAVGTVFSKTELVQVAILGYFILGEPLTINELLALLVTTFGVILLAVKDINDPFGGIFKSFSDSSTICWCRRDNCFNSVVYGVYNAQCSSGKSCWSDRAGIYFLGFGFNF